MGIMWIVYMVCSILIMELVCIVVVVVVVVLVVVLVVVDDVVVFVYSLSPNSFAGIVIAICFLCMSRAT